MIVGSYEVAQRLKFNEFSLHFRPVAIGGSSPDFIIIASVIIIIIIIIITRCTIGLFSAVASIFYTVSFLQRFVPGCLYPGIEK